MSTAAPNVVRQGEFVACLTQNLGGPPVDRVIEQMGGAGLQGIKAVVTWRGVVAHEDVCFVRLALEYLDLLQEESCGRCTPCRIGTQIMRRILHRLRDGEASPTDMDELRALTEQIDDSSWCGIGNTIRDPLMGLLEVGEADFQRHLEGEVCGQAGDFHGWVTAPCRSTCPSTVDCPWYIFQAAEDHPHIGAGVVRQDNPLPAIIGRTCHHPCEGNCTLKAVGEPIAINSIKRWCADHDEALLDVGRQRGHADMQGAGTQQREHLGMGPDEAAEAPAMAAIRGPVGPSSNPGERVAIVGAGPAGLSCAYYLARRGYRPVIFEALPVPGGMLWVGIPEYRLPKEVIRREVALIEREGAEIRYNQCVGQDVSFAELQEEFGASFIAVGAHSGKTLRIPGEDLPGSMDAIDFLRKVALGEAVDIGERVLVIGGGNSAMDAARTSIRLGAKEVTVVYRRAREQMPANPWEIEEAEEEGVNFRLLSAPISCEGDTCVSGLVCQPMELGPPDESGRRSPVAIDCEPFSMQTDSVIAAVGQMPDFAPFSADPQVELNKWGYLQADGRTFMTTKPGVFVGGDAVTGGASVIEAIFAGKKVAKYMDMFLRGEPVAEDSQDKIERLAVYFGAQDSGYPLNPRGDYGERCEMLMLPPGYRRQNFEHTELGLGDAVARAEAKRCLRCHRPIIIQT